MKVAAPIHLALLIALALPVAARAAKSPPRKLDTARIELLTGAKGTLDDKENVFKVTLPRGDIAATATGVKLTPGLGLTAWAAFIPVDGHPMAMMMGDMVLTEDQVNPVMSVALDNGLEVTALHNHFLWDSPKVMFMHIGGMGDVETLAMAVGKVLGKIKETAAAKIEVPHADIDPLKSSFDPKKIEALLGLGDSKDGVLKITIGRTTKMGGHEMGKTMGVNTWAAFAGSEERAVVDGDFAVLESELQGVLKALRGGGVNVVAIHNHMSSEQPRILFLHYWGIGPIANLVKTVHTALGATEQARKP